jgi:transcription antitermination factor NusG
MAELEDSKWFVVKTNSRAEKKVYDRILGMGIKAYLPLVNTIRQWSDRKKKIEVPLISSTLFVFCSVNELAKLYSIQGFHSVLYYLNKPAVVRHYEINNLKLLLQENLDVEIANFEQLVEGDKVEVINGPFQGLIATSMLIERKHKLIIEIEGIEQKYMLHIPRSFVKKLIGNS